MIQRPNAVGLILCKDTILEETSKSLTLVKTFSKLFARAFPTPPTRFTVFAVLTDGLGDITLELLISRLDTLETIYKRSQRISFMDPLREVRFLLPVSQCSFPEAGRYEVSLQFEGEVLAQCVLTLVAVRG